jgi:hypothetical protein
LRLGREAVAAAPKEEMSASRRVTRSAMVAPILTD